MTGHCEACGGRLPFGCRRFCRRCVWLVSMETITSGRAKEEKPASEDVVEIPAPQGAVVAGQQLQARAQGAAS